MATRNITFTLFNGFTNDLITEQHNLSSDTLQIRLVTDVAAATDATNTAFTEVTGANYSAGGIACSQTVNVAGAVNTIQSAVDFLWSENASGFTGANSAIIYNSTSSRAIAFADLRDGATAVDSTGQDVDINLENGTDLFTVGG